ncbi:class I adenylate-forming enzyme family protein [Streptomonospora salina]|uniref:Long-chain acyl-CoA synthetase n=1 Tax=Streptomonospora salina TaxID=104205 RepID=A0A841E511_9ACTN|nr:AMP-binding protein [Streptomonospora salina]MBB5996369.1 long-chain acyl-CoA synthetase [Streptomonospora salina]
MEEQSSEPEIARPTRSLAAVTAQLLVSGGPFEMETAEVGGVATRVWKHAPPHMRAVIESSLEHGEATALVYGDERLTHSAFYRSTAALARRLIDDYGVAKGDRVAIAMRNYPEWVIAYFAATAIGAIAVPLNSWWSGPELEFGLTDSGAAVLVADRERIERLGGALERLELPLIGVRTEELPEGARSWDAVLGTVACDQRLPEAEPAPDDPCTLFYTSGTTGRPKAAVGSHRNLATNIVSGSYSRFRSLMRLGLEMEEVQAYVDGMGPSVVLCVLPLFHATGAQTVMLPTLANGGTLVLMYKWDPEEAMRLVERERVSAITAVPSMIAQMTASPRLGDYDLSSLMMLASGGAPAAPALVSRTRRSMHEMLLGQGYGLTECSATATTNGGSDYLLRPDSAGLPVATVDIAIFDAAEQELPPGEIGEVWIRGPGVVHGYWQRPQATAAAFSGGWLRTGDLGRLDDEGFLYIVDRVTDMIIRGGENVYCAEVEAAVHEHPAVAEVAVVGIPDEVMGEEVGAVVRLLPGRELTGQELAEFLEPHLAGFKIPSRVHVVTGELPRNAAGKLLKKHLKREYGWSADEEGPAGVP